MDPYRYPSYNLANFGLPSALVAAPDPTHLVIGSPAVGPPCQPQLTRCWYRQIQSKTVCLISIPWCSKNKSHKPIIWTICIYIYIYTSSSHLGGSSTSTARCIPSSQVGSYCGQQSSGQAFTGTSNQFYKGYSRWEETM